MNCVIMILISMSTKNENDFEISLNSLKEALPVLESIED